jgi:Transglycosylase SLT domain/D-alanyl-D-alanine carboxypeptidase
VSRLARGLGLLAARSRSSAGQVLPLALGGVLIAIVAALALAVLAGALTGAGRTQRAADLAALSGARSMRDDLPALLSGDLGKSAYIERARAAARHAADLNGVDAERVEVAILDRHSFPPVRVRVAVRADVRNPGGETGGFEAHAAAEAALPASYEPTPALAYRQGKPMRPDVAAAFDRMARAAANAGIGLTITSAYRSDAEQARLFAQHPDPRWVAPPGRSLHRCGTELDLGPPAAYGWLAANAARFGFLKRYAWEPWHFGYTRGPAPCSAPLVPDGQTTGGGMPSFVPAAYRAPIQTAASRWKVSAGLLAAQLMAESGFNPGAVSAAGARGIAQFLPGTAAAYGLHDPFDAESAIEAQAHLMADLLGRFGSTPFALAAYNAGPGAVAACGCVPPYPETQAYVARILALMGSTGEVTPPDLEVRLVD